MPLDAGCQRGTRCALDAGLIRGSFSIFEVRFRRRLMRVILDLPSCTLCSKEDRMNTHGAQPTADEKEILALIERWSKAVREGDRARIRQDHDANLLMFDVPPPFSSRGIDAYMATWETFFDSAEKPVMFHFTDVEITAGSQVAFVTGVGHCVTTSKAGQREPLDFRLTVGLRKSENGRWIITHEHHSLPAD
jgi:ketosteroid isomerase-like protein